MSMKTLSEASSPIPSLRINYNHCYTHDQDEARIRFYQHHHHVPGLLQTSAIMAFQFSLSSVLMMSSLSGDSFFVTKLFRLSAYIERCLPLILVTQISPLYICFSSPPALFICQKNCSCLFLAVLSRDLRYSTIFITSSFDFFSVHNILIVLRMYHITAALSLLSRSMCVFKSELMKGKKNREMNTVFYKDDVLCAIQF